MKARSGSAHRGSHLGEERLSAYLDAELPAAEKSAADTHLRECPACARHLEELLAVDAGVRGLGVEAPPGYFDDFPARMRARLEQGAGRKRHLPMWTWAAAAGLLLAVVAPLTLERIKSTAPTAAVPAAATRDKEAVPEPTPPPATAAPRLVDEPKPNEASLERPAEAEKRTLGRRAAAEQREQGVPPRADQAAADSGEGEGGFADAAAVSVAKERKAVPEAETEGGGAPAPPAAAAAVEAQTHEDVMGLKASPPARSKAGRPPEALAASSPMDTRQAGFQALSRREAHTAAQARALRDDWLAFSRDYPDHPQADEALVHALEAGAAAFRLSGEMADRVFVEEKAAAYLRRADARQRDRVRALLESLGS